MDALAFLPATELAARIRGGDVSAAEVIEATLRRIDVADPDLNAFVEVVGDERWPRRVRSRAGIRGRSRACPWR